MANRTGLLNQRVGQPAPSVRIGHVPPMGLAPFKDDMIDLFTFPQWIAVGLAGFTFGLLTLRYLLSRPRLFVLLSGLTFFIVRVPSEADHVERVTGAAVLWTFFTISIVLGNMLIDRKYK